MRCPPISPSDLTEEQRQLFDRINTDVGAQFHGAFTTARDDGALLGPWNPWLHDPELGSAFWAVTQAMKKAERIPDAARQVAILVTGAHFGAAFEIYAHAAVARSKHGMSDRKIATLAAGQRPEDLSDEEAIAHDVAAALVRGGVLAKPLYDGAVASFGQDGANELIYLVGLYCFVSMTLNGFDVPVPEQVQNA